MVLLEDVRCLGNNGHMGLAMNYVYSGISFLLSLVHRSADYLMM